MIQTFRRTLVTGGVLQTILALLAVPVLTGCRTDGTAAGSPTHAGTGPGAAHAAKPAEMPADPAALDRWLADREAAVPDLVPGTEKHIRWHGEPGRRTPLSIIYLHGFSASRQELNPVVERVADAIGANLFYTRFTGHGRDADAMGQATVKQWIADTREAWRIGTLIGEEVIIMGTSTGGALAAWLAAEQRNPAALVLASPNFGPADSRAGILLWPGGRLIARLFSGRYRSFEPLNEAHARYWTERYPTGALKPMMQTVRLAWRAPLEEIAAPALVLYTEADDVVSVPKLKDAFDRLGSASKELLDLPGADHHVLAGDIVSPHATDAAVSEITSFLRRHLPAAR
jgi:esterase/lipase